MLQTTYPTHAAKGFEGQLSELAPRFVRSYQNAEATAAIPFGRAAVRGDSADEAKLPSEGSQKLLGIAIHTHGIERAAIDEHKGYPPGAQMGVMRQGAVYVIPEDDGTTASSVYFRHTVGDDPAEVPGRFRTDEDDSGGARADQIASAEWLEDPKEGEPTLLYINLP